MYTLKIRYRDRKGNVRDMTVSLKGDSADQAKYSLERRFKETFPLCDLIYIGGQQWIRIHGRPVGWIKGNTESWSTNRPEFSILSTKRLSWQSSLVLANVLHQIALDLV